MLVPVHSFRHPLHPGNNKVGVFIPEILGAGFATAGSDQRVKQWQQKRNKLRFDAAKIFFEFWLVSVHTWMSEKSWPEIKKKDSFLISV